jgi:hypothetical protein
MSNADRVAKKIVEKAFEGRTGHGGEPSSYRQMSPEELEAYTKTAYQLGVQHASQREANRNHAASLVVPLIARTNQEIDSATGSLRCALARKEDARYVEDRCRDAAEHLLRAIGQLGYEAFVDCFLGVDPRADYCAAQRATHVRKTGDLNPKLVKQVELNKATAVAKAQEDPEAEALTRACENAAHTFASLIANDDDVLAAIRKLDDGPEMVEEIRDVNQRWTDAGQVFLKSMHTKGATA